MPRDHHEVISNARQRNSEIATFLGVYVSHTVHPKPPNISHHSKVCKVQNNESVENVKGTSCISDSVASVASTVDSSRTEALCDEITLVSEFVEIGVERNRPVRGADHDLLKKAFAESVQRRRADAKEWYIERKQQIRSSNNKTQQIAQQAAISQASAMQSRRQASAEYVSELQTALPGSVNCESCV